MSPETAGTAELGHDLISRVSPATGERLTSVPVDDAAAVRAAVEWARAAAEGWSALTVRERARHLRKVRQRIIERIDDLAAIVNAETGKPLGHCYIEVASVCLFLAYASRAAPRVLADKRVGTWPLVIKRARVQYSPCGVIGQIAPWNYPIGIFSQVVPFALVAGNTMVIKPSELTPDSARVFADVVNSAGIDLLAVVCGYGPTGEALVRAGIDKLVFTGSPATGRRVLSAAADSLTPVIMELGGKDPMIVTDRADVGRAAASAVAGAFFNSGQTCTAVERVFVTAGVHDAFVNAVLEAVDRIRQSDAQDAQIGAMTRLEGVDDIEARLESAVRDGARILRGGRRRSDLPGCFFEPTVVVDVDPTSDLMQLETFGPVLPIVRVENLEEAIALANGTEFGLNSSVFSTDSREVRHLCDALDVGGVNVNDAVLAPAVAAAPFGGVRSSGFGRAQGEEAFREFSKQKVVVSDRLPGTPAVMATLFNLAIKPSVVRRALGIAYARGLAARVRAARGRL